MALIDSTVPPGGRGFNTTAWTLISQSRKGAEEDRNEALERLQAEKLDPVIVIGAPLRHGALLYNAAVVIDGGEMPKWF